MGARFERRLKGHPHDPALLVSAGSWAPLETGICAQSVADLVGLAPECAS